MFRGKEDQRPDTLPQARITSENRRGNPPDQKHNATQQYEIKNNEPEQEPILCDECSRNNWTVRELLTVNAAAITLLVRADGALIARDANDANR